MPAQAAANLSPPQQVALLAQYQALLARLEAVEAAKTLPAVTQVQIGGWLDNSQRWH